MRQIWIEGIPSIVRKTVWALVIGNPGCFTKQLYDILSSRGEKLRKMLKEKSALD